MPEPIVSVVQCQFPVSVSRSFVDNWAQSVCFENCKDLVDKRHFELREGFMRICVYLGLSVHLPVMVEMLVFRILI